MVRSGGNGPKEELTNQAQEEIGEFLPDVFAVMEPLEPGTFPLFELGDVKVLGTCTHGRCDGTDGVGWGWGNVDFPWTCDCGHDKYPCTVACMPPLKTGVETTLLGEASSSHFLSKPGFFTIINCLCAPGVARQCSHTLLVFPKLSAQAPFFTSKAYSHVNFPRVNPWKFQLCAAWTTVADFTVSAELHE